MRLKFQEISTHPGWTFDGERAAPCDRDGRDAPRRGAGANEGLKPRMSMCVSSAALPGVVHRPARRFPGCGRPPAPMRRVGGGWARGCGQPWRRACSCRRACGAGYAPCPCMTCLRCFASSRASMSFVVCESDSHGAGCERSIQQAAPRTQESALDRLRNSWLPGLWSRPDFASSPPQPLLAGGREPPNGGCDCCGSRAIHSRRASAGADLRAQGAPSREALAFRRGIAF